MKPVNSTLPSEDQKQNRQILLDDALNWIGCQSKTERRIGRRFLYLIARRVRTINRYHAKSPTRSELRKRLEMREEHLSEALATYSDPYALDYIEKRRTRCREFNLDHLKEMAALRKILIGVREAQKRGDLRGRKGHVRAARNYDYPPHPLLVMYLRELYRARTGQYPADENSDLSYACNCIWEFATHEPTDGRSWQRQIKLAKRVLEIKSDSPWFILSGDGPDTGFTHFCALQSADALVIQFVEELSRKGITTPRTAEAVFRSAFIHEASSRLNDLVR